MFTYAVMSFASTDGADLEEAFSEFAGVADEMYRLTFGGCHGTVLGRHRVAVTKS